MATDLKRVEIGFGGGQVVSVRIADEALASLRREVESGDGWHDLETEDGTVALQLSKVVFVRIAGAPHTIGFSGN
jgi:hypothetical protein